MDLNDYQKLAENTAVYPEAARVHVDHASSSAQVDLLEWFYLATKLNGEAGELAEEVAKCLRDENGVFTASRIDRIVSELGDILWYWALLCKQAGFFADVVAQQNIEKLQSRKNRGVLHGRGSNR